MEKAASKDVGYDSELGLRCPKCGGVASVRDSRHIPKAVRRRRECAECGHRFTTREQIIC